MDLWASQPAFPTPFHQQHTTPNTNIYIILYYHYIIISVTIHQSMIYTKTTTLSLLAAHRNAPTVKLTFALFFLTLSLFLAT